jgi:hypothetical protein
VQLPRVGDIIDVLALAEIHNLGNHEKSAGSTCYQGYDDDKYVIGHSNQMSVVCFRVSRAVFAIRQTCPPYIFITELFTHYCLKQKIMFRALCVFFGGFDIGIKKNGYFCMETNDNAR